MAASSKGVPMLREELEQVREIAKEIAKAEIAKAIADCRAKHEAEKAADAVEAPQKEVKKNGKL